MQNNVFYTSSLVQESDYDPTKLTSFGEIPPADQPGSDTSTSRISSLLGVLSTAFRRSESVDVKAKVVNDEAVTTPTDSVEKEEESVSSAVHSEAQESTSQEQTQPENGESGKRSQYSSNGNSGLSSFFKKQPPVALGLTTTWASDDACRHCYNCSTKFTTFFRKHHCRFCGRIFCDPCSKFRIPGKPFGIKDSLRACEVCYRETLKSLLENHYESLSEDMLQKITALYLAVSQPPQPGAVTTASQTQTSGAMTSTTSGVWSTSPSIDRSHSTVSKVSSSQAVDEPNFFDPLRRFANRSMTITETTVENDDEEMNSSEQDTNLQLTQLKQLFENVCKPNSNFKFETKRSFAKTYYNCFKGESLMKYLMQKENLNSFQSAAIAKEMIDFKIISLLHKQDETGNFSMNTYYRPGKNATFMPTMPEQIEAPQQPQNKRHQTLSKTQSTGSQVGAKTGPKGSFVAQNQNSSTKTNQMNVAVDAAVAESLQKIFFLKERAKDVLPYRANDVEATLSRLYKIHLTRLCSHLLAVDDLDAEKWHRNLLQIVYQVVRIVKPRSRDFPDAVDIRRCVKIKKIYDSTQSAHFEYVDGLVFTKTLCHRKMRTSLHNPKILLLQSGLDFERDSHQLTTLDVVVHQESEQMQRNVAQIVQVKPTLVFCGGSIPALANKFMRDHDLTAASYVKPHILEHISRFTGASIIQSVDSLALALHGNSQVQMGNCRNFSSFSIHPHTRLQKTFLCLSGCDPIGCTLLIKDNCYGDLIKVKRILKMLILAAYDGLVLNQYLLSVRVNPHSFDLAPPYTSKKAEFQVLEDEGEQFSSGRKSKITIRERKRSKSFSRPIKNEHKQHLVIDALDLAKLRKKLINSSQEAFNFANSGLLTLSPLIKLPNPAEKSKSFDKSRSRIYFESSLFGLFGLSFEQGKKALSIPNPAPPMWQTKCLKKPFHPFLTKPLINLNDEKFQELLTDFRRKGFLYDIVKDDQEVAIEDELNDTAEIVDEKCWIKPLSIFESQCLHVLTSTFSMDSQLSPFRHCDGPRLVSCPFHTKSDLSLGAFLEKQCFVPTTICPRRGCGAPLVDHVRYFASNVGRVEIVIRPLAEKISDILSLTDPRLSDISSLDSEESHILSSSNLVAWSMCQVCRSVTPFAEVTDDVWGMSLSSFLQFKFYCSDFQCIPTMSQNQKCEHSFVKNYLQFFAKDSLVAVIKYCPIHVYDIALPSPKICLGLKVESEFKEKHQSLMNDHQCLTKAILGHFDVVQQYLENCRTTLLGTSGSLPSQPSIDILSTSENFLSDERKQFITSMAALEVAITDPAWDKTPSETVIRTTEQLMFELFQNVNQSWLDWNDRLKNLIRFLKTNNSTGTTELEIPTTMNPPTLSTSPSQSSFANIAATYTEQAPVSDSLDVLPRPSSSNSFSHTQPKPLGKSLVELITDSDMFKMPIFKSKLKLPIKSPFDQSSHYVFRNQTYMFPVACYDTEPSSMVAFALSTDEYGEKLQTLKSQCPNATGISPGHNLQVKRAIERTPLIVEPVEQEEVVGTKDRSVSILVEPSMNESEEEGEDDHGIEFGTALEPIDTISLKGVKAKIASRKPVLDSARFVATKSPNSSRPNSGQNSPISHTKDSIQRMSVSSNSIGQPTPSPRYSTPLQTKKEDSPDFLLKTKEMEVDPHIRIAWTDSAVNKEAVSKFSVTIYHAVAFAEIRSALIDKNEDDDGEVRKWLEIPYLRSLARSATWQVTGGKSGLKFFQTKDNRLVLKQVSKEELKTIFKIAPEYSSVIRSAHETNRPSALVPILGAYNVSYENGATGRSSKIDVVVMLNLFRSYNISDKFDLKGSERNRFVKQNLDAPSSETDVRQQQDEMVLMDENLLIRSLQDPLYVLPHAKQLLLQAIASDTQFLARNSVMDYSLLVGIDVEKRCIVVGIIDYLRTFTFDKKLEYVVKSTGLLGGQGKAPTVLYPGKYRDRFISAMKQFFLEVPDHWFAYETHNFRLGSQIP